MKHRQICKLVKQAVRKTVAFGPCRFKSCSAGSKPQSLNWRRRCLENSWSADTGLRVRIPPVAFYLRRRVLTGRQPVPKTGDPFGSGGSSPPASAHKPLWQNWQMHLPAKQGSDHSGIRGRDPGAVLSRGILCFPGCFHVIISEIFYTGRLCFARCLSKGPFTRYCSPSSSSTSINAWIYFPPRTICMKLTKIFPSMAVISRSRCPSTTPT